ncbi:hypothetical protein PCE1_003664 [Barthelona sp. PCE]
MFDLEIRCKTLEERLKSLVADPTYTNCRIDDFGECYFILSTNEGLEKIKLSMFVAEMSDYVNAGALDFISTEYAEWMCQPEGDCQLAIEVSLAQLADETVFEKVMCFKKSFYAHPYMSLIDQTQTEPIVITHTNGLATYLLPLLDDKGLTVYFELSSTDSVEKEIIKVFVNEFDAMSRDNKYRIYPRLAFSATPVIEVQSLLASTHKRPSVGYVSIGMYEQHLEDEVNRDNCINSVILFRSFLNYHVKATKSNMQARMRNRYNGLLKDLKKREY